MDNLKIALGFSEAERDRAAQLYWDAFGPKLEKCMGPAARGQAFFARVMNPDYALTARDAQGRLLGFAGFKTAEGSLAGGGFGDLCAVYGVLGALWRTAVLSVLEREVAPDTLLMDGICVAAEARSRGVGSRLLTAIKDEAAKRGLRYVRLDVIDTNPRARALYERQGFEAIATETLGPLRYVFGFSHSTTMRFENPDCRNAAN